MKKRLLIIIFVVIVILLLIVSFNNIKLFLFQAVYAERHADLTYGELCAFHNDGELTVLANRNEKVEMAAVYNSRRQVIRAIMLTPCSIDNIRQYVGKSYNELQEMLGSYHMNTGEGFFIPSYLTADGYAVCFGVQDNVIWYVQKYDLFTGESVEIYYADNVSEANKYNGASRSILKDTRM